MKNKLGIILDSFACKTKKELEELGIGFLPLQVEIDGNLYIDGVTKSNKELGNLIMADSIVKTSMPNLDLIKQTLSEYCSKYEQVLYLGISSKLSNTFSVVSNFGKEYSNFHVVDNSFVGEQYVRMGQLAQELYLKTNNMEYVKSKLAEVSSKTTTYIIPRNLKRLIGGGRLKGIKKFIMVSLKFLPLIKYESEGKVSVDTIKRTINGIIKTAIDYLKDKINQFKEHTVQFIYGTDEELTKITKQALDDEKIIINDTNFGSSLIMSHTGADAVAITIYPKLHF
ncbi:DegV family protein [Mycoplasma elephantis]|uniref:DegV family protein n=1 Tax=Mycoplasma elephantis TaxID=114882 RepID=UPI00048476DA|nr:DegV family protein [Mycoplasma elephantis]